MPDLTFKSMTISEALEGLGNEKFLHDALVTVRDHTKTPSAEADAAADEAQERVRKAIKLVLEENDLLRSNNVWMMHHLKNIEDAIDARSDMSRLFKKGLTMQSNAELTYTSDGVEASIKVRLANQRKMFRIYGVGETATEAIGNLIDRLDIWAEAIK